MNLVTAHGERGAGDPRGVHLEVDGQRLDALFTTAIEGTFHIRYVIEVGSAAQALDARALGPLVESAEREVVVAPGAQLLLANDANVTRAHLAIEAPAGIYRLHASLHVDHPAHRSDVLRALLAPSSIVTVHLVLDDGRGDGGQRRGRVERWFDGTGALGFVLADLPRMRAVIEREHGAGALDLLALLTTTELSAALFRERCFALVWGLPLGAYPVYAVDRPATVAGLVGEPLTERGVYPLDPAIESLSVLRGHHLIRWPALLEDEHPTLSIAGTGRTLVMQPHVLRDADGEATVTSFVCYRVEGELEAEPLVELLL